VRPDPRCQISLFQITAGQCEHRQGGFSLRRVELVSIQRQEEAQTQEARPLVSVYEGMVPDDARGIRGGEIGVTGFVMREQVLRSRERRIEQAVNGAANDNDARRSSA
jgi:hypothetical protein